MLISIEGNIGSGKSTIIKYLKTLKNDKIVFVDEPVDEWQNIKSNGKNALELFYENQKDNAFWFQILAYITRLRNLLATIEKNPDKLIVTERSIYTDKFVFAKMLYESGNISDIEFQTYNYWFDTFREKTKLNYILYVNTKPEECIKRINTRNRTEEKDIKLEYLQACHEKHLEWMQSISDETIIEIDGHVSIDNIQSNVSQFISSLDYKN
jgi:deoxyguanosine kinase